MRYMTAISVLALSCFGAAQQLPSTTKVMRVLRANAPVLVSIARCKTAACAEAAFRKIENPGEAALVTFYSKLVAVSPRNRAAAVALLRALPKNLSEATGLSSTDSFLYSTESVADIDALGRTYWDLNRRAAAALRLWPNLLANFIRYGEIAFLDPHNDYGDWAAKICRANPKRFLRALRTLSPPDQCYFSHRIIDPHGCKEIAIPEAE